jgi:hypothetical protein
MDRHKESIDVATGDERGGEVRHYGAIGGVPGAMRRCAIWSAKRDPHSDPT